MHCPVKESWKHLYNNGFESEDLGVPGKIDHLVANMFHIGFIEAAFPSAPTICVAVITHLVDDVVEHIQFVSSCEQLEP